MSKANIVFHKVNLIYEMNRYGGVHTYLDVEFQRVRTPVVAALQSAGYAAARYAFEQCFVAMNGVPPDTMSACRRMF